MIYVTAHLLTAQYENLFKMFNVSKLSNMLMASKLLQSTHWYSTTDSQSPQWYRNTVYLAVSFLV